MCGRYTNTVSLKKLAERFGFKVYKETFPRFNIAPGQDAPVVIRKSPNHLEMMRWGLVPGWAKEEKIGYKMINARAETVHEKPSFKRLLKSRRCLVLSDGYYEWKKVSGEKLKIPMRIVLKNRGPFAYAGLWDAWKDPAGGELHTFAIITCPANPHLAPIHDRMPVILSDSHEKVWLDPEVRDFEILKPMLKPYPANQILAYPVSRLVNNPKNDRAECIEEVVL